MFPVLDVSVSVNPERILKLCFFLIVFVCDFLSSQIFEDVSKIKILDLTSFIDQDFRYVEHWFPI